MGFVATSNIAHRECTLEQGKSADFLRPELLAQFVKDKVVKQQGKVAEGEEGFTEQDALSALNRTQLKQVMKDNFDKGTFVIHTTYSDEQLRSMIRKITPNIDGLKLPAPIIVPPEEPPEDLD